MAKVVIKNNPVYKTIFNDLEKFREFCVSYGYRFNEANLYDMGSYPYQQFNKYIAGKKFKDMWAEDARRLGMSI